MELSAQSKYMWRGIEYGTSPKYYFPPLSYDNPKGFIFMEWEAMPQMAVTKK